MYSGHGHDRHGGVICKQSVQNTRLTPSIPRPKLSKFSTTALLKQAIYHSKLRNKTYQIYSYPLRHQNNPKMFTNREE